MPPESIRPPTGEKIALPSTLLYTRKVGYDVPLDLIAVEAKCLTSKWSNAPERTTN